MCSRGNKARSACKYGGCFCSSHVQYCALRRVGFQPNNQASVGVFHCCIAAQVRGFTWSRYPWTKMRAEHSQEELLWSCCSSWCCFKGLIQVTSVGFLCCLQELSFGLHYFKVEKDKRGSHNISPFTATLLLPFWGYYPRRGKNKAPVALWVAKLFQHHFLWIYLVYLLTCPSKPIVSFWPLAGLSRNVCDGF